MFPYEPIEQAVQTVVPVQTQEEKLLITNFGLQKWSKMHKSKSQ